MLPSLSSLDSSNGGSINLSMINQPSNIHEYVCKVVDGEEEVESNYSTGSKVAQGAFGLLAMGGEVATLKVSLDSPIPQLRIPAAISGFLGWGWLDGLAGINAAQALTRQETTLEKRITGTDQHLCSRISTVALVTILGLASEIPWIQPIWVANENLHVTLRILLMAVKGLGTFPFSSYSLYLLLKYLKTQRNPLTILFCCSPSQVEYSLQKIKNKFCDALKYSIDHSVKWTPSERKDHLLLDYLNITPETLNSQKVTKIFEKIFENSNAIEKKGCNPCYWMGKTIRYLTEICALTTLYQTAVLANMVFDRFNEAIWIRVFLISLAVGPPAFLYLMMPGEAAEQVFHTFGRFFSDQTPPTFGEYHYPKVTRLLQLLALTVSVLTFPQTMEYVAEVFNWRTDIGKALTIVNVVAVSLMLLESLRETLDDVMEKIGGCAGSPEVKNVYLLKQQLLALERVIKESSYAEFGVFLRELLGSIENQELKNQILACIHDQNELTSYIDQAQQKYIEQMQERIPLLVTSPPKYTQLN